MWWYHDGMGWWMVFGGLWMFAFWAVAIGLAVWGVNRMTGGRGGRHEGGETPMEIARKRLAQGEITMEEFEKLRDTLQ